MVCELGMEGASTKIEAVLILVLMEYALREVVREWDEDITDQS